tara:strand:- start:55 stop:228 length:174 start_codon:yes stop_codon:yes gene_type:complete
MKIKVSIKNVYGSDLIYPECDNAEEFTKLTGTKTLSQSAIESIKRLGYAVEVMAQTL